MLLFVAKYAAVAFAVWFVWGLRNWIRKPWAEYISHSRLKDGTVFLKCRHWHVLPPWTEYVETWHRGPEKVHGYWGTVWVWSAEKTGKTIPFSGSEIDYRSRALTAMLDAAEARKRETEELIGDAR